MKAVAITGFGGAACVGIVDIPLPACGAHEVSIEGHAASLNPADWKLREGWLADVFLPAFPYALGFDVAGVVADCGARVTHVRVGDRVVAKTAVGRGGAGALAQRVVVPCHLAQAIGDDLSFEQAAALPTAGITAWEALVHVGDLRPGQSVLINGGAGGTGSFAIAIAVSIGARVAATARPDNHPYLASLGAELALDYRRDDLAEAVRAAFGGGVDLLLDTVGQGALADPLAMVRNGGALVTIGTLVKNEPRPAPQRGIRIATAMSSRDREAGQLAALIEAVRSGRVKLPAIETIPARDATAGIERLKQGHVRGKLVVAMAPEDWS
ncbi:MAG: NADP-dependent oxidoreductase [Sphingomonas bacterium]|nr:NADP-dependent oxidoreductase [Sphingomonas bacterium]